ncbi:MAG: hypothetical protein P4L22_01880 [Candidatus Babeliales bacterium]|nr:hypothetical protein [Candidatus Babeliales bacterium]
MKQALIFVMLLLSLPILADAPKKPDSYVKLIGREIQGLDGITNALDATAIKQIILVRSKIKDMIYGELDLKTKQRVGNYLFDGKRYDMGALVKFEEELNKEPNAAKSKDIHTALEAVKKEFLDTTQEFIERIAWTKSLVVDLIQQSFNKRKIKKSLCFEWINTPLGKEEEVFATKVKSLKEFDIFLNHVNMFLGDLIFSCPKAFAQFKLKYSK